jgi:hypothetical protein
VSNSGVNLRDEIRDCMRMREQVGKTTYQCLHCRLAQRAEVRVISLNLPDRPGYHRGSANSAIAMLMALKKCPRCGHFDREIANHNRHNVRAGLIMYLLVIAAIGVTLYAIPQLPREAFLVTLGVFALGFVLLFRRLRHRYPADVESRVTLIGSTSVNQQWW